ncbi:DUF1878 family protein [Saccharibacillus kuerlensis]|uniref:DUF1878 family protein n=1 Tax=Saccharibacillus kuerlensis TaxID=459527 RepID=A0ABQ2L7B2_9BACL|nr:DUF1878 family protein [Saccharibacillus kuerlensis]GGO05894.1 hypothetical protein GCM10010969_32690 [Saccharibacillus kuerlensis]
MPDKDLEERVDRMEFYLSLMRDMVVDPESYALWDYIMSEELNEEQANQMLSILKKHHAKLQPGESELNKDVKLELDIDLKQLLHLFEKPANEAGVYSILLRASKLPQYPLYASLLEK